MGVLILPGGGRSLILGEVIQEVKRGTSPPLITWEVDHGTLGQEQPDDDSWGVFKSTSALRILPLIWLEFPHTFIHVADALEQLGHAILFHRVFCLFLCLVFASLTHLRHLCLH